MSPLSNAGYDKFPQLHTFHKGKCVLPAQVQIGQIPEA